MTTSRSQQVYAEDKLAGLYFETEGRPCLCRPNCGFTFNYPLDPMRSYVAIDPETDEPVGIYSPTQFTGSAAPPLYRVFLLRPLLPPFDLDPQQLTEDELKAKIVEFAAILNQYRKSLGF